MMNLVIENISELLNIVLMILAIVIIFVRGRSKSKKLEAQLVEARKDILFLLAVEKEHCENNQVNYGQSFRNMMRKNAKTFGSTWSEKNTASKIEAKLGLSKLENNKVTVIEIFLDKVSN